MSTYPEQVKADAKAAADYIRAHGWCQGALQNSTGACCAAGAAGVVTEGLGTVGRTPRWNDLAEAFRVEVGDIVPYWNDAPGRTKEEVLAVFDKIANS